MASATRKGHLGSGSRDSKRGAERAAAYARVSTEMQAEDGLSIAAQFSEIREYAAARGWTVVSEFVDAGISGQTLDRPGLQTMLICGRAGRVRYRHRPRVVPPVPLLGLRHLLHLRPVGPLQGRFRFSQGAGVRPFQPDRPLPADDDRGDQPVLHRHPPDAHQEGEAGAGARGAVQLLHHPLRLRY